MELGSFSEIDPEFQVRWAGWSREGPDGDKGWGLDRNDSIVTSNRFNLDTYLNAVVEYSSLCKKNNYNTVVIFTTGPAERAKEYGYQRFLKHEHIRTYVQQTPDAVLFDFADILTHNDAGEQNLISWRDYSGKLHSFPYIHDDNKVNLDGSTTDPGYHFGQVGAVRIGKATWYMLARIAGWNGL